MTRDEGVSRRELLRVTGAGGLGGLAGCKSVNPLGSNSTSRSTSSDRPSNSDTDASGTTVFDGGDLRSFVDAVENAATGGGGTLEIENGQYRFDPLHQPDGTSRRHATISNVADLTIEGNDATFVFTSPLYGGFQFERSQQLTIRNLTVDFDPLPFTQGTITAVSERDQSLDLHLDEGFPGLDHEMFQAEEDLIWGTIHRPDGKFIRGYRGDVSLKFSTFIREDAENFQAQLAERASTTGLREGRKLTVLARSGKPALDFFLVDQLTVENVEINAGSGGGFATGLCTDPEYVGCSIKPPEDSGRHIGANADGFRIVNCLSSGSIRDCHVDAIEDDGIVVQRTRVPVVEIRDQYTVDVSEWPTPAKPGDVFDVISQTGVKKGTLPPVEWMTTVGGETVEDASVSSRRTPETLTFAEPIDDRLAVGDLLGNREIASRNFEVRDNVVRNLRGHCVRIATSEGVVEGNELEGATHNIIELECDSWGHFISKGWVSDVTIRNNRISRSGLNWMAWDNPAAVFLHHRPGPDFETEGRPNEDVTIVGNEITSCASVGMDLSDARGISVEDNELGELNQLEYRHGGYGVRLSNVEDVSLAGNYVEGATDSIEEFGVQYDSEEITRSDNEFQLDGTAAPVNIRTWAPVRFEFNRTVEPDGGDLSLAFRCVAVRLLDASGTGIVDIDVGAGDRDDVLYGTGVFEPEQTAEGSWRWMGGADEVATMSFPEEAVAAASTLEIEGVAFDPDISAQIYLDDHHAGTVQFDADDIRTYQIGLS